MLAAFVPGYYFSDLSGNANVHSLSVTLSNHPTSGNRITIVLAVTRISPIWLLAVPEESVPVDPLAFAPMRVIAAGTRAGVRNLMAFGFGFNKQKVLSAAEKFVQQGKLQNAISEYEKILKNDPKDLTVNNTVGDLYARLGDTDKAIGCFKSVGDAYAAQGFTVKGIAMYKKITKLKPSLDGVLKLAELYTQQGLFNDARAQYLHVADEFLRSGELEQAVRIFQKILEMDPENVPMRVRLAEVYIRLGKKN
jgi:thioredoxin-like negative regulator of GroEL